MDLLTEQSLKHLAGRWATVDTAALEPGFALLARGTPVSAREIAEAAGIPEARVRNALASHRVGKGEDGRMVELYGVSIFPGAYRACFEDEEEARELFTCCALVAAMIPSLVGRPVEVSGEDPVTGEQLALRVYEQRLGKVAPPSMVATLVETEAQALLESAGQSFCRHARLFSSTASAARFASTDSRRRVVSVEELFALGRALYSSVWDPNPQPVPV